MADPSRANAAALDPGPHGVDDLDPWYRWQERYDCLVGKLARIR